MKFPRVHLFLLPGLVVIATALAFGQASIQGTPQDGGQSPIPTSSRLAVRKYLTEIISRYNSDEGSSTTRYLTSPRPRKQSQVASSRRSPRGPLRNKNASRLLSLQDRADNRAYDGAPPMMLHSKNFAKTKQCIECHDQGMTMGSKFARPISHAYLTNCEQCHVESKNLYLEFVRIPAINSFEGLRPPGGGVRASSFSPPVMPHSTFMRVNCLACHGDSGYQGLQTTHPERMNCVQCHGVAAGFEQTSPFYTGNPGMVLPTTPKRTEPLGILPPEQLPNAQDK